MEFFYFLFFIFIFYFLFFIFYFFLKDLILRLAKEGKILLELDETAEANHATFVVRSPIFVKSPTPIKARSTLPSTLRAYCKHIQFGTVEPMHMSHFNS